MKMTKLMARFQVGLSNEQATRLRRVERSRPRGVNLLEHFMLAMNRAGAYDIERSDRHIDFSCKEDQVAIGVLVVLERWFGSSDEINETLLDRK